MGRGYDGRVRPLVPDRTVAPRKVLLAAPRGYCAGVDRAVEAVEDALERHGPPVYVRKQIVHNLHVVRELEAKGAVFVEEETEVPREAVVVLSAHGVAPEVYANAAERRLTVLDATCPLVTKVHLEARRFAEAGRTIVLIGHAGHEEVVGTTGQAPGKTILVQTVDDARTVDIPAAADLAYLTQTTLSVDETDAIIRVLRDRFPRIQAPPREDICYATQNRQDAVKALADRADVVLVIGSANSSNSRRLAEVARERGVPAHLLDDETEIDLAWLEGVDVVGVTSGASAPERLVERMLAFLAKLGATDVEEVTLATERLRFSNVRV
jgi:4-hydroxy-3-methylbut-2-enyl diphosphate reductase